MKVHQAAVFFGVTFKLKVNWKQWKCPSVILHVSTKTPNVVSWLTDLRRRCSLPHVSRQWMSFSPIMPVYRIRVRTPEWNAARSVSVSVVFSTNLSSSSSSSSSLGLQPITGLDRPNYAFPLVSLLCLISPSLDSKNSQTLFYSAKPPNWRSPFFPSSLYLGECYSPAWVCFIVSTQVPQPP
jgi:hypothetical protein